MKNLAIRVQRASLIKVIQDTVCNDNVKYIKGDIYVKGHFL